MTKQVRLSITGVYSFIHLYGSLDTRVTGGEAYCLTHEGSAPGVAYIPEEDYPSFLRLVREAEYACNLRLIAANLKQLYPWYEFPIKGHSKYCTCRACMSGSNIYHTDLFEDSIVWEPNDLVN